MRLSRRRLLLWCCQVLLLPEWWITCRAWNELVVLPRSPLAAPRRCRQEPKDPAATTAALQAIPCCVVLPLLHRLQRTTTVQSTPRQTCRPLLLSWPPPSSHRSYTTVELDAVAVATKVELL